MAEARVVKFYAPVGYIKSQHMHHKSPLKGAWSRSRSRDSAFSGSPDLFSISTRATDRIRRQILYEGRIY